MRCDVLDDFVCSDPKLTQNNGGVEPLRLRNILDLNQHSQSNQGHELAPPVLDDFAQFLDDVHASATSSGQCLRSS